MPSYDFDTPRPLTVRVENAAGSIAVHATATGTTTVRVDAASARSEEAAEQTRVELRDGTLRVQVPRAGGGFGRTPNVDVGIEVPDGSSVTAETSSADVELTGALADVRAHTASGDVSLAQATGPVRIETASGDVEIDEAAADVTVSTASGDISLDQASGSGQVSVRAASGDVEIGRVAGDLRVGTASGDITVSDAAAGVTAESASGDVDLELVHAGSVRVQTVSGEALIGIARGTPVWLDLHTLSGSVDTEQAADAGPTEGEASVELRVNTVSGDITVRRGG